MFNGNSYNPNLPSAPIYVQAFPPEILQYLAAADANNCRLAVENERYRLRLQAKELREEAYTSTVAANQKIWTAAKSGKPVELLDSVLIAAVRVVHRGPEEHPAYYALRFAGKEELVFLDELSYLDDKGLIHALQIIGYLEEFMADAIII